MLLYGMVESREVTRKELILATSVISSSVMPSAKYSCAESPERFSSGSTAIDPIGILPDWVENWSRQPGRFVPITPATSTAQINDTIAQVLCLNRLGKGCSCAATSMLWGELEGICAKGSMRSIPAMKRYPRRGSVSTKRGFSAESPNASL